MKLIPLSQVFNIEYGNGFELNKLHLAEDGRGVNFVSRTARNNGVSANVKELPMVKPFPSGLITVAVSGSVLESFLQPKPFYTAYHVMVLSPKRVMTETEKLFYCECVKRNKYRYNYGRQANRTLKDLKVPEEIPAWVRSVNSETNTDISASVIKKDIPLEVKKWQWFKYSDLFEIERGRGIRLKDAKAEGEFPLVTAIDSNNGWSGFSDVAYHIGNVISVPRNGNGVAEAFYQPKQFSSTEDVHIFKPKFTLNPYIALFLTAVIRKEKYRYSYGRKWGLKRMYDTMIKLPAKEGTKKPDFEFMENYIKSLPYSSSI